MVDTEVLPKVVANYLLSFAKENNDYAQVRDEILPIKNYQETWKAAPYAPTFVAVDQ